jgi:glycosyltransferase involved in cell wall biosynthesis
MDFWSICPKSTLMTPKQSLCEGQKDIDHCLKCINKGHTRKSFQVIGQSPIYFQNKIHQFKFKKLYSNVNEENAWHNRPQLTLEHFKNIDHAIFPSVTMKKHILNHHKIKKYELIPYGLDQSWFKEKPKHNHQTIQLGFIGSISKHKGLHLIFEALTTLNNKQLNFNIAGPILDKNYYDYIKNNYQEITYHYEGELIEQQLKSFYQKLDLLIVPSLWPENTPFVIYESLALSTNVLASDHESIREQINHPQFLFKPNSHKSLAEKLNKIIEQKLFLSPSPKVNRVEQMIQSISKIYQNV